MILSSYIINNIQSIIILIKVDWQFYVFVPASLAIGVELTSGAFVVVDKNGASGGEAVLENRNPLGSNVLWTLSFWYAHWW